MEACVLMKFKNPTLALLTAICLISAAIVVLRPGNAVIAAAAQNSDKPTRYLYLGEELKEPKSEQELNWLRKRKQMQEQQARDYKPFHDFKFADHLQES